MNGFQHFGELNVDGVTGELTVDRARRQGRFAVVDHPAPRA
jgi:hypothetical protein